MSQKLSKIVQGLEATKKINQTKSLNTYFQVMFHLKKTLRETERKS